jgi:hypothetical protein
MKNVLLAACAVMFSCGNSASVSMNDFETSDESADALSQKADTFVTIRRDQRKCASPQCGGFWVSDLNKTQTESYVSDLNFATEAASLSTASENLMTVDANVVIVQARLGAADATTKVRKLMVKAAWRGLPGAAVGASDKFYRVQRVVTLCAPNQPCAILEAKGVNGNKSGGFANALAFDAALETNVSKDWLTTATLDGDSLVVGSIAKNTLTASNVFLKLPLQWSCPVFKLAAPKEGNVWTMKYANGCVVPDRMVEPGPCARFLKLCAPGYRTVTYSEAPKACSAIACEPEFASVNGR